MRRITRSVAVAIVIVVLGALAVAPQGSAGGPPGTGTGSYVVTGADVWDVRVADGNVFVSET